MTRVTAFKGRLELFANMLSRALEILRFVISDLAPAGILLYAPDVLSFKIAKSAYLLAKVGSGRGLTDKLVLTLDLDVDAGLAGRNSLG